MSLVDLIDNGNTDKNTVHSYLETYEKLFKPKKESATHILEIGIDRGGSIRLWADYFINANIYGLDCNFYKFEHPRIHTVIGDAYHHIDDAIKHKYDVMIDDGPHTFESMISFINMYLPLLKEDGILIIEDVQSIDWTDYFKNVVPFEFKEFIEVYDLRKNRGRYDDILFIVNLSSRNFLN